MCIMIYFRKEVKIRCDVFLPNFHLISIHKLSFNSLIPGRFKWNFWYMHFKLTLVIDGWGIYCKIALGWLPLDHIFDNSTLVQVMAWCRQATSHYLSQCWPRSMPPYGVTMPQWVKITILELLPHLSFKGGNFEFASVRWIPNMTHPIQT